jgi:hypothetical protein
MNQEDILRMAREIGEFLTPVSEQDYIELERFAKQVAQAEREACAKVCVELQPFYGRTYAKAIRARGNT